MFTKIACAAAILTIIASFIPFGIVVAAAAPAASPVITGQHGLQQSVSTQQVLLYSNIDSLWQQFAHDVPVAFQTFRPNVDLCQTIGVGIAYHAQSIEVWPPGQGFAGFQQDSPAQLTAWDKALNEQSQPTCG